MNTLDVDIWSDVSCPWCAIGYAQFTRALELVADDIAVTVRWMPFELAPDLPPEGRSQAEHLGEIYGHTSEGVAGMREEIEAKAEAAGFPLAFAGEGEPPEAMMWNTNAAHRLLRWALAWKGPEVQTTFKLALFEAHFRQRRNISDPPCWPKSPDRFRTFGTKVRWRPWQMIPSAWQCGSRNSAVARAD